MTHEPNKDIISIREWMSKEPHLPKDFDDEVLKKFLHSCHWSLERTKKCIDLFCVTRSQMTNEVYSFRDPLAPKLQDMFSVTVVAYYQYKNEEIVIHKYNDPKLEKFSFYDLLKTMTIHIDHWIQYNPFIADGHYMIIDMSYFSLKMIPKINIMFLRDFLLYLLDGNPVRLKHVFAINAPAFYDVLYGLVKPALPAEICNIIHFFSDYEGLHNFIDKKYLPTEYGGEAQSFYEKSRNWLKVIEEDRQFFCNDNLWKADMTKKLKNGNDETMNGSFRTLSID